MCSFTGTRATVRPTTSRARSSNDLERTQPLPMSSFLPLFLYSLVDQVERVGKGRGMREELRSLRSLQDGNENRGQLFALLSQRCELFHADNSRFHEQFQPVGAFFNLAQRIAAFRDELIRSLPTRSPLPSRLYRLCRITPEGHHG